MKDASTDANITTALEMLMIGMTPASGLVFLAEVWPSPETPEEIIGKHQTPPSPLYASITATRRGLTAR